MSTSIAEKLALIIGWWETFPLFSGLPTPWYEHLVQEFILCLVFGEKQSEGMIASAVSCSISITLVKTNACCISNKYPNIYVKSSAQTNWKFVDT